MALVLLVSGYFLGGDAGYSTLYNGGIVIS